METNEGLLEHVEVVKKIVEQPKPKRNYGLLSSGSTPKKASLTPAASDYEIINTENYDAIFEACREAALYNKMIGVTGFPGAGKTTALEKIRQHYQNLAQQWRSGLREQDNKKPPFVIYIRVGASAKAKDIFRDIYTESGMEFYDYSLNVLIDLCAKNLARHAELDGGVLLIVDEASKLSTKHLEIFHELRDQSNNGFGVVFAGSESFYGQLMEQVKKGKKGMAEFSSRISEWVEMKRPSKAEIKAVIVRNGIEDQNFIDRCFAQCKDYRKLHNLIMDYKRTSNENDQ